MRVAILSRGYGKTAGIWRVTTDLAEAFRARGIQVTYFCADPPAAPPSENLRFVAVPAPRRPYALRVPLFARRASAAARRETFDIVHGQATDCRGADVITAHSCHRYGMDLMRRTGGAWEWVKKTVNPVHPAIYALERFNFSTRGHRRILSVSSRVKQEIVATYGVAPGRIRVVPNGVDLGTFDPARRAARRARVRARLGLGEAPVVLFVGYEYVRKGLRYLLEAMPRMRHADARLVVIGKPPTAHARRHVARHRLESRVLFTGPVAEVEAYYASADVFAFPTLYEAFGLVIAEAMASGLPVLTTRVAGAAEWMEDGRDSVLIDAPPDPERIAAHLDALLDDEALRLRLGAEARRTAEREWAADTVAARVLEIYREVLEEKAR
jgi:UDP-glucose:(heptosyl)LPS alpha-1,3-glucosyltransferase